MRNSNGITLIEMMIVTAIIAGTIGLAISYINNRNTDTKSFLRKFTVLSRELHTRAKLNGVTYRLVLDLGEPGDGTRKVEHKYWVERGNAKFVMSEKEEERARERLQEDDPEKQKDPKGFEIDTTMVKEPSELPHGLSFDRIELTRVPGAISEGRAFIHYLPQGLVDEAAIHIKGDKGQAWTIAIHPLTGRAELISKSVSLKEITDQ